MAGFKKRRLLTEADDLSAVHASSLDLNSTKRSAGCDVIEYAKLMTVNENGGNEGDVHHVPFRSGAL